MTKPKPKDVDAEDTEDGVVDIVDMDNTVDDIPSNVTQAVVKMKLKSFCCDVRLCKKFDDMVMGLNRVMGEAYAFANFHILRQLSSTTPAPATKIDRNFYYRCILAVSVTNCRKDTLSAALVDSMQAFDILRTTPSNKIDMRDYNQVMADLSIIMATMAVNHLWTNIARRVEAYVKWRYPGLKGHWKTIARAVVDMPNASLKKVFALTGSAAVQANKLAASKVAEELRAIMPLPSGQQFACRANLTLPMYHKILKDTEMALHDQKASLITNGGIKSKRAPRLRMFTLLPAKSGFTISHIPISSMMLMKVLKMLKLEKINGDGRDADVTSYWKKYFNLNAVETRNTRFGNRIVTDGCAVSVLLQKKTCICCTKSNPESIKCTRFVGIDPGFTSVVTCSDTVGPTCSYSSKQYYHDAKIYASRRRTDRWNKETAADIDHNALTFKTANIGVMEAGITEYLRLLPELLQHRASKGYRNMRFMRFVHKQKAIQYICDMIAPPKEITKVGFGDWSCGYNSPISRRTCGPIQQVKLELKGRANVEFHDIDEHKTSVTCFGCYNRLCNQKAETTRKKKDGIKTTSHGKVHSVLHCKNSDGGASCCKTTWNRDVNASKNMLMLMMLEHHGMPRPAVFCRAER